MLHIFSTESFHTKYKSVDLNDFLDTSTILQEWSGYLVRTLHILKSYANLES